MSPAVKQREPSPALPSYIWDPRLQGGRYVEVQTGRMVKRDRIVELLRRVSDLTEDVFVNLADLYLDQTISAPVFEEAFSLLVKRAWAANAALAVGGWDRLSENDRVRLSQGLKREFQAVNQFAGELGDLSERQIRARAASYASNSYGQFYELNRQRARVSGEFSEVRLVTVGDKNVCEICLGYEAMGWQPLEDVPWLPPGLIHVADRCDEDFR